MSRFKVKNVPIPKVIGIGSFGCVHKPSLTCIENNIEYKNKVSKYMNANDANIEMGEYTEIQEIDEQNKYHLGIPVMCKFDKDNVTNVNAIRDCDASNNNTLLIMEDGGVNLKDFAIKYSTMENTPENQRQMELFWLECHRLFMGIKLFLNNNFIHFDIKPQNIVYDETKHRINYIDFGKSKDRNTMIDYYLTTDSMKQSFWWNYPPEIGFYAKNVYMEFVDNNAENTTTNKILWFDKLINDYKTNVKTKEIIAIKNLLAFLKNPITIEKQMTNNFINDLRNFVINDTYDKTNHEQFLFDSTATVDIYGLGLSLMYVLTNTAHLIDNDAFKRLYNTFYDMMNANLSKRRKIDYLIAKYEIALENCDFLQKHGKHFMNNELVDIPQTPIPDYNKINELVNIPIVVDPEIINAEDEEMINTHLLKSSSPTKGGKRWLKSRKVKSKKSKKTKKYL
jgi:serine/threonine protein kinase